MSPGSVLFVAEGGDSSCAYYRAHLPAKGLREHGWQVAVSSVIYADEYGILTSPDCTDMPGGSPDIVVCRRMTDADGKPHSSAELFSKARSLGQIIYIDLDDDPWTLPEWNPAHGTDMHRSLAGWIGDMEAANGVLVSTPALAKSVLDNTQKTNVIVCRNGVDVSLFDPVHRQWPHERLRLGWAGLVSFRGNDLGTIVHPLRELFSDPWVQDHVEFWHLGSHDREASVLDVLGRDFPGDVVEVPWVPIGLWPQALAEIDVAVIPQIPGPFANARSTATGLAMAAAGVPFAATDTKEYVRLFTKGVGYLADEVCWSSALDVLVRPQYNGVRSDIRTAGLQYAATQNPKVIADRYLDAFEKDRANA